MKAEERTFVAIKPDGVKRGIIGNRPMHPVFCRVSSIACACSCINNYKSLQLVLITRCKDSTTISPPPKNL